MVETYEKTSNPDVALRVVSEFVDLRTGKIIPRGGPEITEQIERLQKQIDEIQVRFDTEGAYQHFADEARVADIVMLAFLKKEKERLFVFGE